MPLIAVIGWRRETRLLHSSKSVIWVFHTATAGLLSTPFRDSVKTNGWSSSVSANVAVDHEHGISDV